MRPLPLLLVLLAAVPVSAAPAAKSNNAAPVPGALAEDKHQHAPEDEQKDPRDETLVDYLWRKSDVAFHAGDYERAVGIHRAIVIVDPTDVESYSVGSWLLWSMGKGPDAMAFIKQGLDANPKDYEMWDAAGQHYDLQKKLLEAKAAYGQSVQLAGKDAPELLRRRYAHACEHAGDLEGSLDVWKKLVADYPNDAVDKNNMARVQRAIEEKKDAIPETGTRS